jgi:sRNA-binding protein
MIDSVTIKEQLHWDRYLYLFGSVEALAFTAAGFFFGREVNRGRAQAAEGQAKEQANRAAKAEKKEAQATANGQALSKTLEALADGAGSDPGTAAPQQTFGPEATMASPMPPAVVPAAQLRGLANLAREMFPRR